MPGDGLALAVRIRGEVEGLGVLELALEPVEIVLERNRDAQQRSLLPLAEPLARPAAAVPRRISRRLSRLPESSRRDG